MEPGRDERISDLLRKARAAEEFGNLELARRLLEECVALGGDAPARGGKLPAAWFCYGRLLHELGEPALAIEAAKRAIEDDALKRAGNELLGMCHEDLESWDDAEACFRTALEIEEDASVLILLAVTLNRSPWDRREEAMDCYRRALELEPENDEAHYNLGVNHVKLKRFDEAETHLRRAIEIDPRYAAAKAQLGLCLFARDGMPALAESEELLREATELEPSDGLYHVYLANTLWRAGRIEEARIHYAAAVLLEPDCSAFEWCLGGFLGSIGESGPAEEHLGKAVELDPQDAQARFELGKFLLRRGRRAEAEVQLREAHRLGHERALQLLD